MKLYTIDTWDLFQVFKTGSTFENQSSQQAKKKNQ